VVPILEAMTTTFSIDITFRVHPARHDTVEGIDLSSPKHSFYHAHIVTNNEVPMQANYQSPWITEWDDECRRIERMPPNEALCALLDHVKQAINDYQP
jgi:hypothetical protein